MAIGYGIACPKPELRKRVWARRKRMAAKVIRSVRALCVARDGYCRVASLARKSRRAWLPYEWPCWGPSAWAHLGAWKRFKTRGQIPARRHTIAGSFMCCQAHHEAYDAGLIRILAGRRGAEGPLRFQRARR